MDIIRKVMALASVVLLIAMLALTKQLFQSINADELVVIQSPFTGSLSWYTTPGVKLQLFGRVTTYYKRSIYIFKNRMRFNDGAHADMTGSIQYELPTDPENLTALHVRFGSQDSVQKQLIQTIVDKAVYMTGPLMSSKESYAERRNALIWYVEDQVANGVYRTRQRDERIRDPLTDAEKTITIVEVTLDKNSVPERQEESSLQKFRIKPFNFSITELSYEDKVEHQIASQQQAVMDVQTAIAESKKAEQRKLTVVAEGEAEAKRTQWEQEAIKAREVTKAEQEKAVAETEAKKKLAVAQLAAQEAEQYKKAQLLRADADAEYKRRVMEADGALTQKLDAMVLINERYASAIKEHQGPWVPSVVIGGNSESASAPAWMPLMQMLTAQTAKQLSVDMGTATKR